ncbi:MAG: prepilin-type N-terminal cleavage/methylation domain-containing protein [Ignavibacteria bacterium]|jgi:prepilin-type N-terminal cleavage/methylation domain-containing protein|nr:prepilin-type N-terminal cleavage/methylation domain-containing protein [Ignavibacteria bacterium]MCU7514429.1 prepilin-type N-terminal cleavage/methylation domain-containing protein [Ignavibacteria bacterium]
MALLKKDIKNEQGFTIIETLTAIVILGLIMIFSAMLVKRFFFSPKALLKGDALTLASAEMERSLSRNVSNDTSYSNSAGNLLIERKISVKDSLQSINVSVMTKNSAEVVLTLHAYKKL